jgi:calcineurin-like phosphoesterase family protein
MGNVRFIADLHLGHRNMAIKRGFSDEFEQTERIVEAWNSVVNKKDVTYILGDITMEKKNDYYVLDRLKGIKHVILGNHDRRQDVKDLLKYVDSVSGMIKYRKDGINIFLTHCPVHPREMEYRIKYNIHGHIHEHNVMTTRTIGKNGKVITIEDLRYINVSCEQVNYTPKLLSELI